MTITLANNLRRLMDSHHLSQDKLAQRTRGEVSQRTISNMLAGKASTNAHIEAVAKAFKLPTWRLLVDPDSDVARLVDAYTSADPDGRDLIQKLIQRELAVFNRGGTVRA